MRFITEQKPSELSSSLKLKAPLNKISIRLYFDLQQVYTINEILVAHTSKIKNQKSHIKNLWNSQRI